MTMHLLQAQPAEALGQSLAEFEAEFTYPLGPGRSFRISHGEDYPRFFRAMGPARCCVAEIEGRIVGALGVAARRLLMPDGSERAAAYIGDLKVARRVQGSRVFLQLARAADAWARPLVTAAFGVVMDGTGVTPPAYTGRCDIPPFHEIAKITIWRIATDGLPSTVESPDWRTAEEPVQECYKELSHGRYACPGGSPAGRSEMEPAWLLHSERLACGCLEDTRRAKRLIADDGSELLSAHLSFFAYRTSDAGAALIQQALARAGRLGYPALFVAVPREESDALAQALGDLDRVVAPATVYGAALVAGPSWNINTSEI